MAGQLPVPEGAVWAGAPVVGLTRMPDGRVAVARTGRSTVLVQPNLLVDAELTTWALVDRRAAASGDRRQSWPSPSRNATVPATPDPKEGAAEQGAADAGPPAAVDHGRSGRRMFPRADTGGGRRRRPRRGRRPDHADDEPAAAPTA